LRSGSIEKANIQKKIDYKVWKQVEVKAGTPTPKEEKQETP
jgi:hypothetical protein